MQALNAADFVGAAQCAECHPSEFEAQSHSHHAQALTPILDSPIAGRLIGHTVREKSGLQFKYTRAPDGIRVTVERGAEEASALLNWAFGAGVRGITPVGTVDRQFIEHRVSWYTTGDRAGLTMGHSAGPPGAIQSALGPKQSADVISRCFECHATCVRSGPDLTHLRPGIECERCHGPGSEHVRAPSSNTIENPGRLPPAQLVQACGQCHRLPLSETVSRQPEIDDPESIRFAPLGLMASLCFRKSGTLSCLTCHDPHSNMNLDAAFYTSKCLQCHSATSALKPNAHCRRAARENCLPCHMPKSKTAPYLAFTDHRIRVTWQPIESALAAGNYQAARQLLKTLPTGQARSHLLASRVYDGLKIPAKAVEEAQAAISLEPSNLAAYLQLGQIFLEYNTPAPAVEIFATALRIAPDSLLAHLGEGLALKGIQRFEAAEKELAECLRQDPRMSVAFDALASLYIEMVDYGKLEAVSKQYLAPNPSDYRGYYYLATAQEHDKKDSQGTEALLRKSLGYNPNFAASHALLGKLLLRENRDEEAVAELERAVQLRPDYPPAHMYLGNAYKKMGRQADASREFQKLRELNERQSALPSLRYHQNRNEK